MINSTAREKAMSQGIVALENTELLSLLLAGGRNETQSVRGLAAQVLSEHGGALRALGMLSIEELTEHDGLDRSKALILQAAMELGRRLLEEERGSKLVMKNAEDIYNYYRLRMSDGFREECHVMLLDTKGQFMGSHVVSVGGLSQASVDVRVVMRYALLHAASQLVLVHNHPSGNPMPSKDDEHLTQAVVKACHVMNIRMMDHVIIGDNTYYSFYEHDKI